MDTVNLPDSPILEATGERDDSALIVTQDADTAGMPNAPEGVELGMRPERVGILLTQDEIDEADGLGKYAPDAGEGRADNSGTEEASTTDDATEPA